MLILPPQYQQLETPFYLYNTELLAQTLVACKRAADQYGYTVHYALKANSNPTLLKMIQEHGFGADCVSGNEVLRAAEMGFDPAHILFAGVGKSDREMRQAIELEIGGLNVESAAELEVINALSKQLGKKARIALRINPNVDAGTHHYITTGLDENKFGINVWELDEILHRLDSLENVEFVGIHVHIGSQITRLDVFKNLCRKVNQLNRWFIEKGRTPVVLNLGGGLGINYHQPDAEPWPDFEAFFQAIHRFLEPAPKQKIHFELGRSLVAQCGSIITRVLFVKRGLKTNFAIVDAGMTELIRPALYQAFHLIQALDKAPASHTELYDVVGPVCETSDCFGKAIELPRLERGDLLAIRSAGAYGEVMRSEYNLRNPAPSVFVNQTL